MNLKGAVGHTLKHKFYIEKEEKKMVRSTRRVVSGGRQAYGTLDRLPTDRKLQVPAWGSDHLMPNPECKGRGRSCQSLLIKSPLEPPVFTRITVKSTVPTIACTFFFFLPFLPASGSTAGAGGSGVIGDAGTETPAVASNETAASLLPGPAHCMPRTGDEDASSAMDDGASAKNGLLWAC